MNPTQVVGEVQAVGGPKVIHFLLNAFVSCRRRICMRIVKLLHSTINRDHFHDGNLGRFRATWRVKHSMYIPLNSRDAGMGQRFFQTFPDIQELRNAWVKAIANEDWAMAAMYQVDLEKRRDQMLLHAIERAVDSLSKTVAVCTLVLFIALLAVRYLR